MSEMPSLSLLTSLILFLIVSMKDVLFVCNVDVLVEDLVWSFLVLSAIVGVDLDLFVKYLEFT